MTYVSSCFEVTFSPPLASKRAMKLMNSCLPGFTELQGLHDSTHTMARNWLLSLSDAVRGRITGSLGNMPEVETEPLAVANGPHWHWWEIAALPLDDKAKVVILAMRTLQERLAAIQRVLLYISKHERS